VPTYLAVTLQEAESEWSTHHAKAVIETNAKKVCLSGLRSAQLIKVGRLVGSTAAQAGFQPVAWQTTTHPLSARVCCAQGLRESIPPNFPYVYVQFG
jgi:hypothetical protein